MGNAFSFSGVLTAQPGVDAPVDVGIVCSGKYGENWIGDERGAHVLAFIPSTLSESISRGYEQGDFFFWSLSIQLATLKEASFSFSFFSVV